MPDSLGTFLKKGGRLAALELARASNAAAWNSWRQQTDIFGDQLSRKVDLSAQRVSHCDLRGYDLSNVSFLRGDLAFSNLEEVDCGYSDFHEARLIDTNFRGANLRNARLSRAYLRGANLSQADLRGADLRRTSLTGASLFGTNICGLDLTSTRGLDQAQLEEAVGDRRTRLPPHLLMPAAWAVYDAEPPDQDDDLSKLRILPATVEVAVISGLAQLSSDPGTASFAATADAGVLLSEILGDLNRLKGRCANVRELGLAIDAYIDEGTRSDFDVILLGVRGVKLQAIFDSVSRPGPDGPELLPDAIGALRGVLIQHQLFIGQSHRWRRFLEEASRVPYKDAEQRLALAAGSQVSSVLSQHPSACDPRVPLALERVTQDAYSNDGLKVAIINTISSVENALRAFVIWLAKEARRFLGDAWSTFRNHLAKVLGAGMAALVIALFAQPVLHELAVLYPARFAYVEHVIRLLETDKKE